MKKSALIVFTLLLLSSSAWARDPDLEGRITSVNIPKSTILVKNELENEIGLREYRVIVKQGMISDYKKNDKLKIWLMSDKKEAKRIQRTDR